MATISDTSNSSNICIAVIREGKNAGKRCTRKAKDEGLCEKHKLRPRCTYIHPYGTHAGAQCDKAATENTLCITHKDYENGRCSAYIEQGVNKGMQCFRPCISRENAFCGKHRSAAARESIVTKGNTICHTYRCNNAAEKDNVYCMECQEKKRVLREHAILCQATILQGDRKGSQCRNTVHTKYATYCEKHATKEYLREYAEALGKRVCGNGLRCNTLIDSTETFCEDCKEKRRAAEMRRYEERASDPTRCIECGRSGHEFAKTKAGTTSRFCEDCYEKMRAIEDMRDRRAGIDGFRNPDLYYSRYKYDAERRGLDYALTFDQFKTIVSQPCVYCGTKIESQYNGIDRRDNSVGYILENCVPACSMCNCMKSSHSIHAFVDHCRAIIQYQDERTCSEKRLLWSGQNATLYTTYKKHCADLRSLSFELTESEYKDLKMSACYLCGNPASEDAQNGIDRIDASKGYIRENCAPCCPYCNRMKNTYSLTEFVEKCRNISKN